MWVIGCEESHPISLRMTFTGEKDQLVKCQTLCSKMNAQEEQKIIFFFSLNDCGV